MAVVAFQRSTRVKIDLNVRAHHGLVRAGFEDADGPLSVGDYVVVFEPEDGIEGLARVQELDDEKRFVFLDVNWSSFIDDPDAKAVRQQANIFIVNTSETSLHDIRVGVRQGEMAENPARIRVLAESVYSPKIQYLVSQPVSYGWTVLPETLSIRVWASVGVGGAWLTGGLESSLPPLAAYLDYGGMEEGPQRDTATLVRPT